MIVFNSCDTRLKENKLSQLDIQVWKAGLIVYKEFGYTTKLYCETADIPALKENGIFDLYDEIDTELFNNHLNNSVNTKYFWSYRKLEALYHEFNISNDSIYSDTDIIMLEPFNLDKDLFWCKEEDPLVYCDWNNLSKPDNYELPEYLENTICGYNCGIIYIKDKKLINEWYKEYMSFVINNPCKLIIEDYQNNIFACNSEQRIIKGIFEKYNIEPNFITEASTIGFSDKGIHLYALKILWKYKTLLSGLVDISIIETSKKEMFNLATILCNSIKKE